MTATIPTSIERDIFIEAPINVVWRTVTEPELIPLWFSDTAEIEVQPGGHGELVFTDTATAKHVTAPIVVEAVAAPTMFSFRWGHADGVEPTAGNSMLVEFTLSAEGENTRLRVVERGLHALDWAEEEKARYIDDHSLGWNRHLGNLREYTSLRPEISGRR